MSCPGILLGPRIGARRALDDVSTRLVVAPVANGTLSARHGVRLRISSSWAGNRIVDSVRTVGAGGARVAVEECLWRVHASRTCDLRVVDALRAGKASWALDSAQTKLIDDECIDFGVRGSNCCRNLGRFVSVWAVFTRWAFDASRLTLQDLVLANSAGSGLTVNMRTGRASRALRADSLAWQRVPADRAALRRQLSVEARMTCWADSAQFLASIRIRSLSAHISLDALSAAVSSRANLALTRSLNGVIALVANDGPRSRVKAFEARRAWRACSGTSE